MMRDHVSTPSTPLSDLGPVLGELVHDLANEIQVLHGWALLARGEVSAGRMPSSELDHVLSLSADLGRMLRDVLETVSGQSLSPEVTFDPSELTESLLNDRARVISGLELRMASRLPPEVRVRGRASFWTRAISNLLGNAARHATRVIGVQLRLEEEDGRSWVIARVEDDGPGIPEEERLLMFQPLWRGPQGQTGLGLSATLWMAVQLGGSLRYVEGNALGGAAFDLRVPVSTRLMAASRVAHVHAADDALEDVRLLLIDDDPGVRAALGRLLRRVGAEVRELDPRGEPLEWIMDGVLRARPDFLIVDLHLGERAGVELWRYLAAKLPELARRVIFVSGAVPGDPQWEAASRSGQPILAKPFDLEQLVGLIDRLRGGE
jgi:ActR/RegA family two-component response regulator